MTVSDLGLLFRREPFFRPLTVWTVVIGYVVTALTLFLIADGKRTVLIEPAVPEFHWFMIGVGAVVGACLAPVIWDAWTMGITSERRTPEGFFAVVQLVALVVAAGFAGDFVADLLIEKAAFFGLNAPNGGRRLWWSSITAPFDGPTGSTSRDRQGSCSRSAAAFEGASASRPGSGSN